MFRLAVVLGLVAFCAAKNPIDHCCSAEDRSIIQDQWKILFKDIDSSKIKISIGRKLILKLVELKPEAKALFAAYDIDHPTGGPFSAYSLRLFNGVDLVINLLKDPEALEAALEHAADRYGSIPNVKKEYFQTVGEILAYSLPKVLDEYNALSWRSCFRYILNTISSKVSQ
jgi:DNA-directed RNA polymerase subunit L